MRLFDIIVLAQFIQHVNRALAMNSLKHKMSIYKFIKNSQAINDRNTINTDHTKLE